jgi:hypothetical protein
MIRLLGAADPARKMQQSPPIALAKLVSSGLVAW